jgi:RHS repeat-associated protein
MPNKVAGFGPDTMGYDAENRQIKFNSTTQNYFYDGDGRRVKKIVGSATTVFVYNVAGQLIAEYTSGTPTAGDTSYLTTDHLGSTRVVTDSGGNVKARYDYLPFGEEIGPTVGSRTSAMGYGGAEATKQKFTQKERDSESGLDYFLARYYSSAQGRFTSPDKPLIGQDEEDPQTWNLYLYTSNNPPNRVDPDGERWFYKQDVNRQTTDVQWVNPNEDGTYSSPGEGYNEFIPTQDNPSLRAISADGRIAYHFGETADGGPAVGSLQTGMLKDASMDIVGFFIPARLGLKGFLAGASSLWAKHVAKKAATEAFEEALRGGRHAGFLKNYLTRSKQEIEKGIKSIKKQIATHEDKIANPQKHIQEWQKLDPRYRDALVNRKWPSDFQRQKEQLGILKGLRKQK